LIGRDYDKKLEDLDEKNLASLSEEKRLEYTRQKQANL
jgi:hypothetical protein